MLGVLKTENDADLAGPLDALEVAGGRDGVDVRLRAGEERIPRREDRDSLFVRVAAAEPDGGVHDRDAGVPPLLKVLVRERLRAREPLVALREVERERAE